MADFRPRTTAVVVTISIVLRDTHYRAATPVIVLGTAHHELHLEDDAKIVVATAGEGGGPCIVGTHDAIERYAVNQIGGIKRAIVIINTHQELERTLGS